MLILSFLLFFITRISEKDKIKAECLCKSKGGIRMFYSDLGCVIVQCQDREVFWNINNYVCD